MLSLKNLSPASIKELNKNPSAPKRVHFVNSIVILSTDSDTEEEDVSSTNACDLNLGGMVKGKEGVKEQGKEENEMETDMEVDEEIEEEESEFETDEEVEEILEEEEDDEDGENLNLFPTMEELTHHEWLLKNPRPLGVKARIRAGSRNNVKISCMVGHLFKRHAYIDLESPINIMKNNRPKGFHRKFAYECDFMILEDTTSIIDHQLGEMVFGRPFIDETGLVYNEEELTVTLKQDDEKIMFKMPHTMKTFKQTRFIGNVSSKTKFSFSQNVETASRFTRGAVTTTPVTLYLTRRSLEVLRKFHWMIHGGRFNQLSHVSSPLLSKPGEY
ncbi:hypothetical protein Tco_0686678 [Tanacetum coccineum]